MGVVLLTIITATYFLYKENNNSGIHIIDLKEGKKHLLFYGSRHSNRKSDPMFKDIGKRFCNFNPQIVLVEGYSNKYQYKDINEAILNGESAFVSYLAQKSNIPLDTVEPSMQEQYNYLLSKYDKEKVLAMYVLRQLRQYQREQKKYPRRFPDMLENFVLSMAENGFPISEGESTIEYISKVLRPYLEKELNTDNWLEVDTYSVVHSEGTEINKIYQEVYAIRNEYLKSTIEKYLNKYDRVFVIMGSQHVIDEKDDVEQIFYKLVNKTG